MDLNINDTVVFTPTTNGNDKAKEPIVFKLQYLTNADQSETEFYQTSISGKKFNVKSNYVDVFEKSVISISGLKNKVVEITTAKEWLAFRGPVWMKTMQEEVALFIIKGAEVDIKN